MDHFEVFGLPRRLAIDTAELQRKFYELSRRGHPDFHQRESPERQAEILEASARLNAAYRALRDPLARIEYLVRLEEGRDTHEGATVKPKAPPELLEEMFEIQEALQEAKSAGRSGGLDAAARDTLVTQRDRLRERYDREESRLRGPLSQAWDAAAPVERAAALKAIKESLAVRAYLRTVIDDIDEALGGSQEGYVSHRRH
jgi:molecular chaperone HscB